jgi:predicted PurR-regulated permease PerM
VHAPRTPKRPTTTTPAVRPAYDSQLNLRTSSAFEKAEERASEEDPIQGGARPRPSWVPEEDVPSPYASKTRRWALVVVVLLTLAAAAMIAAPLGIAVVFGAVMAISAYRPYELTCRWLRGRATWAAGLVTLGAGIVVAAVGSVLLVSLMNELLKLVNHVNAKHASSLEGIIGAGPTRMISNLGLDTGRVYTWAQHQLESVGAAAASTTGLAIRTTSDALLGLVVGLLTMYYTLLEGPRIALRLERALPLDPRHTRALLVEARDVGRTAFLGAVSTAVVQGVLAGVGYAVLGVPQPVTWGVMTAVASFLPVVGTILVWVPVSGWLLMTGHTIRAIVLVVYGVLIITSLADYVIRPRLVGRTAHGHPLLTLIALLGGLEVFGLAGLIVGPVVVTVFVAALRLYERELRAGGVPA